MTVIETDIERAKALVLIEILEYIPNSVVSKTVMKKLTGSITVCSVDSGEGFSEKISPFDTFIQIIDGKAEIVIDGQSKMLNTGEGILIPAHLSNCIKAHQPFKMISTLIKSGYE